jgi:hypothetical protein
MPVFLGKMLQLPHGEALMLSTGKLQAVDCGHLIT